MKNCLCSALLFLSLFGCSESSFELSNEKMESYKFLEEMYADSYFPNNLVDEGRFIFLNLCKQIESKNPASDVEVYELTHDAVRRFNQLAIKFAEQDSEIETVARENIGRDVAFILEAYGYNLDIEEAIAPRDW